MATETMAQRNRVFAETATEDFSLIQRLTLRSFHPRALFIRGAGAVWAFYFFWNYDWELALAAVAMAWFMAMISVVETNPKALSETTLGKLGLLHLHPMNFVMQVAGTVILLYGVWGRTLELSLLGLSILLLGHVFGWAAVDGRLARNSEMR